MPCTLRSAFAGSVHGLFVPHRLHLWLSGEYEDYPRAESRGEDPAREATMVHEQIHLFQSCMTGFGFISWSAYQQAVLRLVQSWRRHQEGANQLALPLSHLADRSLRDFAFAYLEQVVNTQLLLPVAFRSFVPGGVVCFDDLRDPYFAGDWPLLPTIEVGGANRQLQGRQVLEGHAMHLESVYSFLINDIPIDAARDGVDDDYTVALDWFLETCGTNRLLEFPLICDLALQTPWELDVKNERLWQQSHPAWRFVQLSTALRHSNPSPMRSPEEAIARYSEYCDLLTDACGFPRIGKVLTDFAARLPDHEDSPEDRIRFRNALRFRIDHPWCGANPFLDIRAWIEMCKLFPPLTMQVGESLRIVQRSGQTHTSYTIGNDPEYLTAILNLHMDALASQILGQRRLGEADADQLQCGYAFHRIKRGCAFQETGACGGSFVPSHGLPVPLIDLGGDEVFGCSFGTILRLLGVSVATIDVQYSKGQLTQQDVDAVERRLVRLKELGISIESGLSPSSKDSQI